MENLQQEISKNVELKRELEQFLESRAWGLVQGIVQQQVDSLQKEVLFTPCLSVDSAFAQEYKKGQLEGRLSISGVIEAEIEMCEINLINLRRNEDAARSGHSNDGNDSTSGDKPTGSAP